MNEQNLQRTAETKCSGKIDSKKMQAAAVEFLLSRVPLPAAKCLSSTQWIEFEGRKIDPHGIF